MNCPVCRSTELEALYTVKGYHIVACRACEAWHVAEVYQPRPPEKAYGGSYLNRAQDSAPSLSGYFDYEAELPLHLRNFQQNLAILHEHATGKKLLDVGCASGHFLLAAAQAGYEVRGIDISEASIAHVREKLGFTAWSGDVLQLELEERFDVITLWETLEHIARPGPVLRKLQGWLRPGGVMVVGTGDNSSLLARLMGRRWWYVTPPDHVVYYNPTALHQVLEDNELQVDGWARIPYHWVSSRNLFMKLLRSFQADPAATLKWARRLPDIAVPVLHGTTMVAIAHQRTIRLGYSVPSSDAVGHSR